MTDINPFEQPPVYEECQVLTQTDINLWKKVFDSFEVQFLQHGDIGLADACHMGRIILEELQAWVKDGKPVAIDGDDLFYNKLGGQ